MFAYGMVLYELLSQHAPFDDIQPALKRNHEIREGHRPSLQDKETRMLIKLQELMRVCWEQEAESRPRMGQVAEWIRAPEFERLCAVVSLGEIKSISCVSICRVVPGELPGDQTADAKSPDEQKAGAFLLEVLPFEDDGNGSESLRGKISGKCDAQILMYSVKVSVG